MSRYIALWRCTEPERVLDWEFYVSESMDDAERVVANLLKQGVHQYRTYKLGDRLENLSSAY